MRAWRDRSGARSSVAVLLTVEGRLQPDGAAACTWDGDDLGRLAPRDQVLIRLDIPIHRYEKPVPVPPLSGDSRDCRCFRSLPFLYRLGHFIEVHARAANLRRDPRGLGFARPF
jgi:hypothetical protein